MKVRAPTANLQRSASSEERIAWRNDGMTRGKVSDSCCKNGQGTRSRRRSGLKITCPSQRRLETLRVLSGVCGSAFFRWCLRGKRGVSRVSSCAKTSKKVTPRARAARLVCITLVSAPNTPDIQASPCPCRSVFAAGGAWQGRSPPLHRARKPCQHPQLVADPPSRLGRTT